MADDTYNSADAEVIDRLGVRIVDVMDEEGAGADERVLALLNVLEFTIAAVECPGCRKQMVKALRQAIPAMLRNITKLAAELHPEAPTESTHVH